jgi:hypothetical protein
MGRLGVVAIIVVLRFLFGTAFDQAWHAAVAPRIEVDAFQCSRPHSKDLIPLACDNLPERRRPPAHYLLIAACFAAGHPDYRPVSYNRKEILDDD